jgi:hypothetical protein
MKPADCVQLCKFLFYQSVQVINPGIIGGLLLPIVGALPDTFIVAASGLGGSQAEAQVQLQSGNPEFS